MDLMPHFGLDSNTKTRLSGTPQDLAASIATYFASSLQNMRLLEPCLICLVNSGAVNDALAAE
jgi:hypothetical protein